MHLLMIDFQLNYVQIKTIFVPHRGARNSCEDQALNAVQVHNGCCHDHTKHTKIYIAVN